MDIFSTLRHQQHIFDLRETTFGIVGLPHTREYLLSTYKA